MDFILYEWEDMGATLSKDTRANLFEKILKTFPKIKYKKLYSYDEYSTTRTEYKRFYGDLNDERIVFELNCSIDEYLFVVHLFNSRLNQLQALKSCYKLGNII